jgi:hypothetical protein
MEGEWSEWTALAVATAAAVLPDGKRRRWSLLGLLVLVGGWLFGTATWLLFPAIAGVFAVLLLSRSSDGWRRGGRILAMGGGLLSTILCGLFPLPEIPAPPGAFATGTLIFELPAEETSPPLIAQVWYPAKANTSLPRSSWLPDPELTTHLPFHRIGRAMARSRIGPDPVDRTTKLPVVFYEHSWTGHRAENVAQVEELASRGFVIVAVDHPGQAARVRYGNGTVISGKLTTPDLTDEAGVGHFETLAEDCLRERSLQLARIRQALAAGSVPALKGRLNLDRMGVFGFSFGGTSAIRLCALDPAFHAGANEDGLFLGDSMPRGPFLFFDEEMPAWLSGEAQPGEGAGEAQTRRSEKRIQAALVEPDRFRVVIDATRHEAFSDRIFTCRIPRLVHAGSRPATEVHRIITSKLGEFFARQLGETTAQ